MTNWRPTLHGRQGPRYLAIANAMADAIDSGELQPGMRLPTHRGLADMLAVSVHTVSQAYAEAERRGLITGERGRGTFVQGARRDNAGNFVMEGRHDEVIDLSIVRPVVGAVHRERLRAVFAELAEDTAFGSMLACRPVSGLDSHREAGATWLSSMGVDVAPSQVIVTNGAAHALTVALATLVGPGDVVVTEQLTDHGIISLSNVLHFRLKGLTIDAQGIVPQAFEEACQGGTVKALVCTPGLSNPTTATIPAGRRAEIVEIARRHNVMLIENDIYRPLQDSPPEPLWNLAPERTCHVSSFTKSVVSGLRTGYLAAGELLTHRLATRLRATSWMANPLTAEIARRWVEDGTVDMLTEWQRRALRERHRILRNVLNGETVSTGTGALHAWLHLPAGWRADNFAALVRLRRVAVTTPSPFIVGRNVEPAAVRIGLGGPSDGGELHRALDAIRQVAAMGPEPVYLDM